MAASSKVRGLTKSPPATIRIAHAGMQIEVHAGGVVDFDALLLPDTRALALQVRGKQGLVHPIRPPDPEIPPHQAAEGPPPVGVPRAQKADVRAVFPLFLRAEFLGTMKLRQSRQGQVQGIGLPRPGQQGEKRRLLDDRKQAVRGTKARQYSRPCSPSTNHMAVPARRRRCSSPRPSGAWARASTRWGSCSRTIAQTACETNCRKAFSSCPAGAGASPRPRTPVKAGYSSGKYLMLTAKRRRSSADGQRSSVHGQHHKECATTWRTSAIPPWRQISSPHPGQTIPAGVFPCSGASGSRRRRNSKARQRARAAAWASSPASRSRRPPRTSSPVRQTCSPGGGGGTAPAAQRPRSAARPPTPRFVRRPCPGRARTQTARRGKPPARHGAPDRRGRFRAPRPRGEKRPAPARQGARPNAWCPCLA